MPQPSLTAAVINFAQATHHFDENLLNSETWAWEAYVGVRYAFLQTYLELRELAVQLLTLRTMQGQPPNEAQRALAQHQAAFRDVQALLLGVSDEWITVPPAIAEWPIKEIVTHVHYVERHFFATIFNALRNPAPQRLDVAEGAALLGEAPELNDQLPLAELWQNYEQLHERVHNELVTLTVEQLATNAPMWEPGPITIRYRYHRFDTHLREHANQLQKTLHWLNHAPNEAKLLLRQLYAALAEVEGALLGADDIGQAECTALAQTITKRTTSIVAAAEQTQAMVTAKQA